MAALKREVFFDIETKKMFAEIAAGKMSDLGVSIVSMYEREVDELQREVRGAMHSFWEEDFPEMWKYFQLADRIIGFNTLGFDVPVLQPHAMFSLAALPHFDIMDKFRQAAGHRISLRVLSQETLGNTKNDVGSNAVEYWKKHDPESLAKLQKYCEMDVLLTRDLYDFAVEHKYLKYTDKWNTLKTVTVDFSYPPDAESAPKQMGLF